MGPTTMTGLRQIKDRWDTDSLFFWLTAVGSEDRVIDSSGRLFKALKNWSAR